MERKRILIIDDDHFVRMMIRKSLQDHCYDITEATDGEMGLTMISDPVKPHLVITDIMMPHRDGLEIIMEIRKKYPHIRLVAISGSCFGWGGDYLEMSRKLGSDAIFPKPIDMNKMERVIADLLSKPSLYQESANYYRHSVAEE